MFHSSKKGVFKLWDFGTIYGLPWVNKLMQTFILAVTQFFESFMLEHSGSTGCLNFICAKRNTC